MNGPIVANSVASFKRTTAAERQARFLQEIEGAQRIGQLARENASTAFAMLQACSSPENRENLRGMWLTALQTARLASEAAGEARRKLEISRRRSAAQRRNSQ